MCCAANFRASRCRSAELWLFSSEMLFPAVPELPLPPHSAAALSVDARLLQPKQAGRSGLCMQPGCGGPSRSWELPVTAAAGRGAVTVDGKVVVMDPDVHEVSSTYSSTDGGQLLLLWQQYRPLLGDTAELTTGAPAPLPPTPNWLCRRP